NQFVVQLDILPGSRIFSESDTAAEANVLTLNAKKSSLMSKEEMEKFASERLEVASYIINKLKNDPNLGRTKLAKIFYLVDASTQTEFRTNYKREAAGPLDANIVYGDSFGYEKMGEKRS